ncbi:NUDIX domain-containing protein [Streptomyces lydicus]|uniref:NUDIX domain-containing protein n=1 Tax=Streptomyces lydicus TaxID=47763 RepID=UPI00371C22CA
MSVTLNVIGAHLYLERDGAVLLGERSADAAFGAGEWHALAGHVEREAVRACVVREAQEETGLVLDAEDLTLVHTVHLLGSPDAVPRLQLFFRASRWTGEPQLLEPDRCRQGPGGPATRCPRTRWPTPGPRSVGIALGHAYSELGWPT